MSITKCKLQLINQCLDAINYNIALLLNILNLNKFDIFPDDFFIYFVNITIKNLNKYRICIYNDNIYHRRNNIIYLQHDKKYYYKNKNIYYKLENEHQIIDTSKTFISINDLLFKKSPIIILLKSIPDIINPCFLEQIIELKNNKIIFKNADRIIIRQINIEYFFYTNKNNIYLKDAWEFCNGISSYDNIYRNLLQLQTDFRSVQNFYKL